MRLTISDFRLLHPPLHVLVLKFVASILKLILHFFFSSRITIHHSSCQPCGFPSFTVCLFVFRGPKRCLWPTYGCLRQAPEVLGQSELQQLHGTQPSSSCVKTEKTGAWAVGHFFPLPRLFPEMVIRSSRALVHIGGSFLKWLGICLCFVQITYNG
ncbi:hypothetical protein VTI28DRAFT_9239 [Corynascus sepedonium]